MCVCVWVCVQLRVSPSFIPGAVALYQLESLPPLKAGERRRPRLLPQDRPEPVASPLRYLPRSFPKQMRTQLWFTGLITRQPGLRETRSGLLSIRSLIALVYELLQFNWTELKVLRFHLPNKSWCVISVMRLDSFSRHRASSLYLTDNKPACTLH